MITTIKQDHYLKYFLNKYNSDHMNMDIVYDLNEQEFLHFSTKFRNLTGLHGKDSISKFVTVLKKLIHPSDYSTFMTDLIEFITIKIKTQSFEKEELTQSFSFRICDAKREWRKINFHIFILKPNIIVGIIEAKSIKNEQDVVSSISDREKEILDLIANGNSTKIIGDKLNISPTTVITHRNNLKKKFNVKNTAELVKKAVKAMVI